ncbi:XRE family transcriptional regulator [Qipengyuania gaetbuli]|uniref:helix-turn-helix domain-containing protein n=1 Tax=Qipengyuania gaetbuli TaxID=266952 RepID=UPI001C99FDFC|nr:XRE family transcriptional regulator [Qipengyuania gaetbuli]MBY6015127.1 XRE family transcriptional regulator [Qipengyuania gaetbuli]
MNAKQCKMARDGLGITGRDLADLAAVPYPTLARFEAGKNIREDSRAKLEAALSERGAQFIFGAGRIGATVPE